MMSDRINVGSDSEEISSQDDQEDDDIYSDHFEQVGHWTWNIIFKDQKALLKSSK